MGKHGERRLRVDDYAYEPQEKENHKFVTCDECGRQTLKKKAKRVKGDWICPDCRG